VTGFRTLDDLGDVHGRRGLVRVDLNVPMQDGKVSDDTRLRAALATVCELADKEAIVLLLSHFGRPKGERRPDMSLALLTRPFSELLGRPVRFIDDCCGEGAEAAVATLAPGDVAISKTPASMPARKRTIPSWRKAWRRSAISTSTTPSPLLTALMRRPKASPICCRLLPDGRWKPN
jgi:phosphoglycerate kinase